MTGSRSLPAYIAPMLAKPGEPFDSDEHLFEVKWDGVRAVAYRDAAGVRIMNRRERPIVERYADLEAALKPLPAGSVLDGEIVVMRQGKPDFESLQKREQARSQRAIQLAARSFPATYIVFDQLYERYEPILSLPCEARRERARSTVARLKSPHILMSEGVVGAGNRYFAEAEARGLEGVVAKLRDSPYLPGKRSNYWIKIKRRMTLPCVVIGYQMDGRNLRSVILAAPVNGKLRYVGSVGSGITMESEDLLLSRLTTIHRDRPVVPSKEKGIWVEPTVYCQVRCMEQTRDGMLRFPVFEGLCEPSDDK